MNLDLQIIGAGFITFIIMIFIVCFFYKGFKDVGMFHSSKLSRTEEK